jgi:hypothetical protein
MFSYRRMFRFLPVASAAVVIIGAGVERALAAGDFTCFGGSIAAGTYSHLNIAGSCAINAGVTVQHDLTVLQGGSLVAAMSTSNVTVDANVDVKAGGVLVLGCEPVAFPCGDNPNAASSAVIDGNLSGENALTVIVHHTTIVGNISLNGGGGGVSCTNPPPAVAAFSPGPYGDFEDIIIGGSLTITGWHSCWLGFLRDAIVHDVLYAGNMTAGPDGNEIGNNSIGGNINCDGNSPAPQIGDSGAGPSTVFGRAQGQCNNPAIVVR